MNTELDELLILSAYPDFKIKLAKLRSDMLLAARGAGAESEQNRTVAEVLREIGQRGDVLRHRDDIAAVPGVAEESLDFGVPLIADDHDRIADSAHSDRHYESIRVRQFEANAVEESLARALRDQST